MKKYSGNKRPFIYGIFSDSDKDSATAVLERLEKEKYAVCCKSRSAMKKASLFIVFISKDILSDEEKMKEVSFAFENGRKALIVFLDDVKLSPGLSMLFGSTQGIFKGQLSDDEFYEKLLSSPLLSEMEISEGQKSDSKKKTIGLLILLAAVVAAAVIAFAGGVFNTIPPDSLLQKLGISGRIDSVKEVYLYGSELFDESHICYVKTRGHSAAKTRCVMVDHNSYAIGDISDVSDFAVLRNLEELSLAGNEIADITPILGLEKLKFLDLTGNSGVSIEGISALKNLEVLNVALTDITDYSELLEMENLKTVYVSGDYYDTVNELEGRKFEVISVDAVVRCFDDLKKATEDENTIGITIVDTVVIPEGETITIRENVTLGGHNGDSDDDNDDGFYFESNGTVIVEGIFEMGTCYRTFNGDLIVKDGGVYSGGMCNTVVNGSFIIEEGGILEIERAHYIDVNNGTFENNGDIYFTVAAGLSFHGCDFINNGNIYFNCIGYGGLGFDNTNVVNNGKCYYYQNGQEGYNNPVFEETTLDFLVEKSFEYKDE